jgi:predicted DNA-binding transcriptional regulator YafY
VGSTIIRQWHLLTLLPKGPRRIDSAALEQRLRERGVEVHRRTIQRDLVELARVFPIVSDERSKPYGWRWADDAEMFCAIPALPGARAGALEIDVVLRVRRSAASAVSDGLGAAEVKLLESALASDGLAEIRARVPDGCALRRWLLGFADAVEVLAPPHLRSEMAAKAARLASVYT